MPITPKQRAQDDQLHASAIEVLDGYIAGVRSDQQRYRRQTGKPMDATHAHADFTKILLRDVPHNMLGALLAEAIMRLTKRPK